MSRQYNIGVWLVVTMAKYRATGQSGNGKWDGQRHDDLGLIEILFTNIAREDSGLIEILFTN